VRFLVIIVVSLVPGPIQGKHDVMTPKGRSRQLRNLLTDY
jgi:hypothetical protein